MTRIQFQKESPARTILQASELFNDFFNDFNTMNTPGWSTPAVNIIDGDSFYRIDLAIPGFSKEDLDIRIEENVLVCSSENKKEIGKQAERFSKKEFSIKAFTRKFNLPDNIDTELIKAQFENGIMSIHLPKRVDEKPRSKSISID